MAASFEQPRQRGRKQVNAETEHIEGCLNGAAHPEVDGKEATEHVGPGRQRLQRAPPHAVIAIHQEEDLRHPSRPPDDPPMGPLISRQIARGKRVGQCSRLAECQGEAFAGYRIDAPGSIADEDHPILGDRAHSG